MTNKQEAFDWDGYLYLAESFLNDLDGTEADEAKVRCGISRAYYAALHDSRIFLHTSHVDTSVVGGSTHDNIINYFKQMDFAPDDNEKIKLYRKVYNTLRNLKADRIKADYKDRALINTSDVMMTRRNILDKSIKQAQQVIHYLAMIK